MDKLFLDTNVVLDLLGEREPFYASTARIARLSDIGKLKLKAWALTHSTVYILLSKFEKSDVVKDKIIVKGLSSKFKDFEDALQYYCAVEADCNLWISRNGKDFKGSEIPIMTPDEFLSKQKIN